MRLHARVSPSQTVLGQTVSVFGKTIYEITEIGWFLANRLPPCSEIARRVGARPQFRAPNDRRGIVDQSKEIIC